MAAGPERRLGGERGRAERSLASIPRVARSPRPSARQPAPRRRSRAAGGLRRGSVGRASSIEAGRCASCAAARELHRPGARGTAGRLGDPHDDERRSRRASEGSVVSRAHSSSRSRRLAARLRPTAGRRTPSRCGRASAIRTGSSCSRTISSRAIERVFELAGYGSAYSYGGIVGAGALRRTASRATSLAASSPTARRGR